MVGSSVEVFVNLTFPYATLDPLCGEHKVKRALAPVDLSCNRSGREEGQHSSVLGIFDKFIYYSILLEDLIASL